MNPLVFLATMQSDLGKGLLLMVLGMGVVFAALAMLCVLLAVFRRLGRRMQDEEQPAEPPRAVPVPPPARAEDLKLEDELVAVIAAAAIAVVGRPVRLKAVRLIGQAPPSEWAAVGRSAIQASHDLRKVR